MLRDPLVIDWEKLPGKVITVISDLHANKRAIAAALQQVRSKRSDQLIILGDILSYGIDVEETMRMVNSTIEQGALLLMGNHDEMYLDLIRGDNSMVRRLRPDLQESIIYNFEKMNKEQFANWPWQREIVQNDVLFSHANPFGNLWTYLYDDYDFRAAAGTIKTKGQIAGVFGHTHRSNIFSTKESNLISLEGAKDDIFVSNPGSVGQPRSKPSGASMLRLSSHQGRIWAEIEQISYDMSGHIDGLIMSEMSEMTKRKMIAFFEK